MANPDAAFGFRPVRYLDGRPYNGGINEYTIANALAANIGRGSLVTKTGTGQNITIAASGTTPSIGVFLGVQYRDANGATQFKPNWVSGTVTFQSEGAKALVADAPDLVFELQASAGFVADNEGQFAGIVVGAPDANGNATTEFDSADITGTADNVKLLRLSKKPRNGQANDYGSNAVAEVLIAIHENRGNVQAS